MIQYTIRRLRRAPLPAIAVLLFAVILSVILCALKKSNDAELQRYEETYRTIPVTFTVTNPTGTKYTNLNIWGVFLYPFQRGGCLEPYVSNLEVICVRNSYDGIPLTGITTTTLSPELLPETGTVITWREGYDASILTGDAFLALIPADMPTQTDAETGEEYVSLYFQETRTVNEKQEILEYTCRLQVAGTYTGGDGRSVYCPYEVCVRVCYKLVKGITLQSIRATLKNNDDLEALREDMWAWFAEPNPLGQKTPWENGEYGYEYYPYALDINDDLLQWTKSTLQTSITTNRICTVLVLCLSAGSGLLIGFLMVRARKREIALLRTMGTSPAAIFCGLLAEQLSCFLVGIGLGGSYNRWQPALQLGILAGVFFAGLTAALLIFLRRNLMTSMKEEE